MDIHNLLVVDWDYFFADLWGSTDPYSGLYDWGHAETPYFIDMAWGSRAAAFIHHGLELPGTTGLERDFWSRFKFSPDAQLFFADSNSSAANVALVGEDDWYDSVWLYDAHHDSGYFGPLPHRQRQSKIHDLVVSGQWDCSYWMVLYRVLRAALHVRYPTWKTWAFEQESEPLIPVDRAFDSGDTPRTPFGEPLEFDRVFVCRSGAWVPPWLDADFFAFLERCPVSERKDLVEDGLQPRTFQMRDAEADLAMLRKLREMNGALAR
jgi:hypothetical protein